MIEEMDRQELTPIAILGDKAKVTVPTPLYKEIVGFKKRRCQNKVSPPPFCW